MEKKDMALLMEVEDTLDDMDEALEQLTGHGHASGDLAPEQRADILMNGTVC